MAERRDTAAFVKLARERFQQGQEAVHKQRQRELDDLAFYAGGEKQWDPETLKSRRAQDATSGMPPVPARPCLTINKVREPVHQVLNQERQSEMGIAIVPADDFGDLVGPIADTEIELREGLIRRIQRESEASDARTWAFSRSTIAGVGYYRVLTRYIPGKSWDKEVYVSRIYNQASVTLDPAHEQPDGSDAEWGFIGSDLPFDRYKAEHPRAANGERNRLLASDDSEFRALGEEYPGWFTSSGDTKSARVVEYFYTERDTRTLALLPDGTVAWDDELPEGAKPIDTRDVIQKTIHWAKIDATQILEETDWEGPDLPIIKVLGEELQPYDTDRHFEGMIRPARDAQQGFNAMVSKWVESVGLAPIPPFQIAEGQVEGYEAWYQAANTRTLPYLPYKQRDLEGNPAGKPDRTNVETPIQAIAASVQMFDEAIKSTTLVPSVQLGQATDARLKSGKAINLLQEQAQLGTSNFLDNLRRSIRYEGQIINNLLFPIYGRPGRLARILTGEDEPETVRIGGSNGAGLPGMVAGGNAHASSGAPASPPSVPNMPPAGGPPIGGAGPLAAGPMGALPMPGGAAAPPPKTYTLTKDANFNVLVKVTRAFDARREEEATTIGNLLQANPALLTWFGDLFFKNQDGPGHEEMAERAEVMLDPKIQQMRQSKQQGMPIPPQAQAQMAQLQGRVQQAEQIMQKLQSLVQGKQMEQEMKLKIATLQRDQAIELQKMKDASALATARITAAKGHLDAVREDQEEAIALAQQQLHDASQAELDRQHELQQAQLGHQQALEQGAQPPSINPNQSPPGTPPPGAPPTG